MDGLEQLGRQLLTATDGLRWPPEPVQLQYTGTSGDKLLVQATNFLSLLAKHVDLTGTWQGLDYGVGWGRMASLMTHYGTADQLDCVDAWAVSLDHARSCGLANRMSQVSPLVRPDELPRTGYDFAFAYSIFTHLPAAAMAHNVGVLLRALKPGGTLLFTVREPRFVDFLQRNNKFQTEIDTLAIGGYWFGNAQSDDYGDAIFAPEWLAANIGGLGRLERLGPMPHEPTQIAMKLVRTG